jgi:hypothetical protein
MEQWIAGLLLKAHYPTIHKSNHPCPIEMPGLGFETETRFA